MIVFVFGLRLMIRPTARIMKPSLMIGAVPDENAVANRTSKPKDREQTSPKSQFQRRRRAYSIYIASQHFATFRGTRRILNIEDEHSRANENIKKSVSHERGDKKNN